MLFDLQADPASSLIFDNSPNNTDSKVCSSLQPDCACNFPAWNCLIFSSQIVGSKLTKSKLSMNP